MKLAILERVERNGRIFRKLECGHLQLEPGGGRAPTATHSKCCTCLSKPPRPVIGKCTAIVHPMYERRARQCGQPAKHIKRGLPRCSLHFHRGTRG